MGRKFFRDVLKQTDFDMLHRQRLQLMELLPRLEFEVKEAASSLEHETCVRNLEAVSGVLNFLDELQDAAEAEGVFTYPNESTFEIVSNDQHLGNIVLFADSEKEDVILAAAKVDAIEFSDAVDVAGDFENGWTITEADGTQVKFIREE